MSKLFDWVDHRTGYRGFVHEALYERIPGGARWRYVWGSTLAFAFSVQMVTGIFLWMAYSPSTQTAWESVFYIQNDMQGGWLLRGLHHFMAQAMVVLLTIHLLQVIIDGAYKAPREFNFWIGLLLMQVVLGLSLTGYLLPWDQKGYWATKVATNLVAQVPVIGSDLQRLAVGGSDYGHHTLTRFFALHAGVLPGLLILLLVVHIAFFRRHGITPYKPAGRPDGSFWPDQVLKDAVACLAVMAVVLGLCLWRGLLGDHSGQQPGEYLGAELGAPADPAHSYSAARPEWYFLFLFQMLKYFPGETEIYGALVIPGAVMLVLFLMPLLGYVRVGHYFNVLFVFALLAAAGALTVQALVEDRDNENFQQAVADAEVQAHRVRELALGPQGIPPTGAGTLLREDPKTVGPQLFKDYCASCHSYSDAKNQGLVPMPPIEEGAEPIDTGGSNLYGFGTRSWFSGLFDPAQIDGPRYFGNTPHREGDMVGWVQENVPSLDEAGRAELDRIVLALVAEAHVPAERMKTLPEVQMLAQGRVLISSETFACTDCHKYHDAGELGSAPDLTGYGTRQWLIDFISNPGVERFYGDNHAMPAFGGVDGNPGTLSERQIEMLADWLRGDWYEPPKTPAQATIPQPQAPEPPAQGETARDQPATDPKAEPAADESEPTSPAERADEPTDRPTDEPGADAAASPEDAAPPGPSAETPLEPEAPVAPEPAEPTEPEPTVPEPATEPPPPTEPPTPESTPPADSASTGAPGADS
ncbi:MAG: cytochrome b N-terminal domain-containing protein [Pirellulales bacterium]